MLFRYPVYVQEFTGKVFEVRPNLPPAPRSVASASQSKTTSLEEQPKAGTWLERLFTGSLIEQQILSEIDKVWMKNK